MSDSLQDTAFHIDAAEKNLERLLEWNSRYDTRASLLLGITIAMMGALASSFYQVGDRTWLIYLVAGISALALIGSLFVLYQGFFPRTKAPNDSLVYFGTIAQIDSTAYIDSFSKLTPQSYLDDLLNQCHINARIVNTKFERLKWSLRLLAVCLLPWTCALYLLKISGDT